MNNARIWLDLTWVKLNERRKKKLRTIINEINQATMVVETLKWSLFKARARQVQFRCFWPLRSCRWRATTKQTGQNDGTFFAWLWKLKSWFFLWGTIACWVLEWRKNMRICNEQYWQYCPLPVSATLPTMFIAAKLMIATFAAKHFVQSFACFTSQSCLGMGI